MVKRLALIPAAYVILRRPNDEVLLQLRQSTGFMDGHWASSAAGHVELNESAAEAAGRECFEELGVQPHDLVPLTTMHRRWFGGSEKDQRVDFFFVCNGWTGSPAVMEPDKASDVAWFNLAALPETVTPHERMVLDSLALSAVPALMFFGFDP